MADVERWLSYDNNFQETMGVVGWSEGAGLTFSAGASY